MYQSLAVKYRPEKFEDVCGQSITTKILEKAVETGTFRHAYLFAGASGCGKTTCARIFAKKINRGQGEPIELDAASQRDIETIRSIRDSANLRSLDSEYKVYIIDECQNYTIVQWQAFLKTIEETPEYTIFIFCTTEPNKLPVTILNRLQRYNFAKIDSKSIRERLKYICQQEGFINYEKTCDLISKQCKGCMRDAITSLEKCASFSQNLTIENAKQVLADLSFEPLFTLTWALQEKDTGKVLSIIDNLYNNSIDLKQFIDTYLGFILDLSKYTIFKTVEVTDIPEYLATPDNPAVQKTCEIANNTSWFNSLADLLLKVKIETKYDSSYKSTIQAFLVSFCGR